MSGETIGKLSGFDSASSLPKSFTVGPNSVLGQMIRVSGSGRRFAGAKSHSGSMASRLRKPAEADGADSKKKKGKKG